MERDYFGDGRNHAADLMEPGRGRAHRGRTHRGPRRGARKPKTGAYPVIYDERISSGADRASVGRNERSAIVRGASWARGLLGEQVLRKGLSLLIEDPHRPHTSRAPSP